MMNKQQIFDTVVQHLATQRVAARKNFLGDDGCSTLVCAYRGDFGMSCAVGCLIKDEDYSPAMEAQRVDALDVMGLLPGYLMPYIALLEALQLAHDSAFSRDQLIDMLRSTAVVYDLDASSVDNIKVWGD